MEHLINMFIALTLVISSGIILLKLLDVFVEQEKRKREKFKNLR